VQWREGDGYAIGTVDKDLAFLGSDLRGLVIDLLVHYFSRGNCRCSGNAPRRERWREAGKEGEIA